MAGDDPGPGEVAVVSFDEPVDTPTVLYVDVYDDNSARPAQHDPDRIVRRLALADG